MAIYESQGFGSLLYEYKGNLTPFDYIAQFKPMKPPEDMTIDAFKKTKAPYCISGKVKAEKNEYKGNLTPFDYIAQFKPMKPPEDMTIDAFKKTKAPYCISGKVKAEKNGTLKRNNESLLYRDLVFLDYDNIPENAESFKSTVSSVLSDYSYILYPTIIKRNNESLLYRDLVFLDYDNIPENAESFKSTVSSVLSDYSYILYPTIKHTTENPRYRLVVKPDANLNEADYKATVKQIAELIGLPFDIASLTWSQLMGLPVSNRLVVKPDANLNEADYKATVKQIAELIGLPFDIASLTWSQLMGLPVSKGYLEDYDKVVHYGYDFPAIQKETITPTEIKQDFKTTVSATSMTMRIINILLNGLGSEGGRNDFPAIQKETITPTEIKQDFKTTVSATSMTMRIINILLNGLGSEGGRNVTLTKFVGLLLNKWVDCDIPTAYDLTIIANEQTPKPLSIDELDKTFISVVKMETRKRGGNYR